MLRLLDSLSLPGDAAKPNEDAFAHGEEAALVLDGATMLDDPLMPGPSDAQWIAQFGARRLLAHLRAEKSPRKALRDALADAEKSFHALRLREQEHVWQTPAASMMLVCIAPSALRSSARDASTDADASARAAAGTSPALGADALRGRKAGVDVDVITHPMQGSVPRLHGQPHAACDQDAQFADSPERPQHA